MLHFWNPKHKLIKQIKNKKYVDFKDIDGTEYQQPVSDYKGCIIDKPKPIPPCEQTPYHAIRFEGIGLIDVDRETAIKIRDFFNMLDSN